jgi:hypothetical protein
VSRTHALALGAAVALGGLGGVGRGGGLGRAIVHLFIWRLIWRAGLGLWRVPAVGPFLVVLVGVAIVALIVFRSGRARNARR